MKQETAEDKWCPFARAALRHDEPHSDKHWATANREEDGEPTRGTTCITTSCMAWRADRNLFDGEPERDGSGHCGLAGPP